MHLIHRTATCHLTQGGVDVAYRLEVFRDKGLLKRWRWRRRAGNGRITETAGESYFSKWNAKRAAHKAHPGDPIQEVM
jgi:uncharacterized protein YegP (UPF0339 family)